MVDDRMLAEITTTKFIFPYLLSKAFDRLGGSRLAQGWHKAGE